MPQFAYPFDPHADNDDNIVNAEQHVLSKSMPSYRVILPSFAPFFETDDIVVTCNDVPLRNGFDYYLSHRYFRGVERTGKLMYGGIWIINPKLSGTFKVTYRTLGDKFTQDRSVLDDYLTNRLSDPSTASWEEVIDDDPYFPPVDIRFDRDAFIDDTDVQVSLREVANVIATKDQTESDMYKMLDDWFEQLKRIVDDSPLTTHQTNTNDPHEELWFESDALHKTGISKKSAKAFNKTINDLATYVNDRGITQTDLDQYVERTGGNEVLGDIVLDDGVMSVSFVASTGITWFRLNLSNGNVRFSNIADGVLHADKDKNKPGAVAKLESGNVSLSVTSRGSAKTNDDLSINDKTIVHDGNLEDHIPTTGTHVIDIVTKDSDDFKFRGKGVPGNPLEADAVLYDATEASYGVAVGSVDVNDTSLIKVAFSEASYLIDSDTKQKVPNSVTVNNVPLSADVVLGAGHFGLERVANLPDTLMPVVDEHLTILGSKVTLDHTHSFDELGIDRATSSVYGVTYISDDPSSTATDRGFSSSKLFDMDSEVYTLEYKANNSLPDDVIDISQYGGNSYLPIPVQGAYGEAGDNRSSLSLVGLVEADNKLVVLRNGQDTYGKGVYYWYGDVLSNGALEETVSTATKYEPKYLKDKGYNTEVSHIYRGSEDCFMARMMDGTYHIILTNGTMDMSKHVGCRVSTGYGGWPYSSWVIGDRVYLVCSILSNAEYSTRVWYTRIADIVNETIVDWDIVKLEGTDYFGTAFTDMDKFYHAPEGIGNDADPNHLICRQDDSFWGSTNLCHGPARNYDAEIQGNELRILHTSSIYLANSFSSKWQGLWSTSYVVNLETGVITLEHGGFPVYLRTTGMHFDNEDLRGHATPGLAANNTGGVIRSRGYVFEWAYSNIVRAAYIRGFKNNSEIQGFESLKRDLYNVVHVGSGYHVKGNYGSVIQATMRSVCLLPNNEFVGTHYTGGGKFIAGYDKDKPYEGGVGFGPTPFRESISSTLYTEILKIPRIVDDAGVESNHGFAFTDANYTSAYKCEVKDRVTTAKTLKLADGVWAKLRADLQALYPAETDATVFVSDKITAHVLGDVSDINNVDIYVTTHILYAQNPNDFNGDRAIYTAVHPATLTLTYESADSTVVASIDVDPTEVTKFDGRGSLRDVTNSTTSMVQSGRYEVTADETLFVLGNCPYISSVGGGAGRLFSFWRKKSDGAHVKPMTHSSSSYSAAGTNYIPDKGTVWFSNGAAAESLNMAVKENGSAGWDVSKGSEVFTATKVAEGWQIYFTQDIDFFIGSTAHVIPKTAIDLQLMFPSTHKVNKFYIYATVEGGTAHYSLTEQYVVDNSTAIYIGYCETGTTQIIDLQVNRATRLGNFREFEEHLNDASPHGLDLSQVTTDDIGLGLLENKDIRNTLIVPTFKEVFNSWYRLSHQGTKPYPAIPAETTTWTYSEATDAIRNTTNSAGLVGMISPDDVMAGDYDFITGVSSTSEDDDWIGVIFAMVVKDGIEHTLSALCTGTDTRTHEFEVRYNHGQGASRGEKTLFSHTTALKFGWDSIGERIITVKRRGDTFDVHVTKMMTDSATEQTFTFDVKDDPVLAELFRGAVRFGYCAQSQPNSTWRNILRPDEDGKNFYASQKLYRDNFSWSNRIKTASGTVALTLDNGTHYQYDVPIPAGMEGYNFQAWANLAFSRDGSGGLSTIELTSERVGNTVRFKHPKPTAGLYNPTVNYNITFFTDVRMI